MAISVLLSVVVLQAPAASLALSRDTITLGDSVTLRWSSARATRAFLAPVGAVPLEGSRAVRPRENSTYVLAVEGAGGEATRAVTVIVAEGSRGSDIPERGEFTSSYTFQYASRSRDALLQRLQVLLQDSLYHSLRPTLLPDSSIVLETNRVLRPELVPPTESRIANRRGALRITIPPHAAGGMLTYSIETCLEYQRRAERSWRPEQDTELHHRHAERLHHLVGAGP